MQANDVPEEAPVNLHDAIMNGMEMIRRNPVVQPEQHVVHQLEHAWITNPVGEPPSTNAVLVAWQVGAIDGSHPAARALMARVYGDRREGREQQ